MMDISLSPGMKNILLSLKETSSTLDRTQERLSTGRKVNSALDNPTNFFASMQLKNLADDLTQKHVVINESIQTIRTADNGITGASRLLGVMRGIVDAVKNTTDPTTIAQSAKAYDEVYVQINSLVADSSYRGTNLIGDSDPSLLQWQADDLPVSLNPSGLAQYTVEGKFLGAGYALYETGEPDIGWVPNVDGTKLAPATVDMTAFPEDVTSSSKLDFVFVLDTTGSMGGYLGNVMANVTAFIDNLQAQGIDGRYAFAKYGDINPIDGGDPPVITPPTFFTDSASFAAALAASPDGGVGGDLPESGLEAILASMSDLSFRADANKRMLLITDATVHTTDDGKSVNTIAGTAAIMTAANIRLDIAAPLGGSVETQLAPLATAAGGIFYNINDPVFFSGGFGVTIPNSAVPTSTLAVQSADYENGVFSILFKDPPPAIEKEMTADKSGLGLYHSWIYNGFKTSEGIEAATKDIEKAMATIRTQAVRFGSGSDILTTRDEFTTQVINISLEGADKLTLADMNEEAANMLMLETRQQLGISTLSLASQASQSILKTLT